MKSYVEFTKAMRQDYTILMPNMLPRHFRLIREVLRGYGYNVDLLETEGQHIAETGLKYVHNDTCYPAILVIGQFIDALSSGLYDPHKVALLLFQTGGGCRASNYIFLLRKALERAGYGYVPVISFNLLGLERHSGFTLSPIALYRMFYAVVYGDIIMELVNQCKPYELAEGRSEALADQLTRELTQRIRSDIFQFMNFEKNCDMILDAFDAIPVNRTNKVRVGIVGEIYVKYSPLGNNNLEAFLLREGAQVVVPGLIGFFMYCVYNNMMDFRLYRLKRLLYPFLKLVYDYMLNKQRKIANLIRKHGRFMPSALFSHTVTRVKKYISLGAKMGEGWLLPAEMLELADSGVNNIVCTQPFGCLPNHIFGKGMMKPLKADNPDINIVAIDYDSGASPVNQENRLKLMLSNALRAGEEQRRAAENSIFAGAL